MVASANQTTTNYDPPRAVKQSQLTSTASRADTASLHRTAIVVVTYISYTSCYSSDDVTGTDLSAQGGSGVGSSRIVSFSSMRVSLNSNLNFMLTSQRVIDDVRADVAMNTNHDARQEKSGKSLQQLTTALVCGFTVVIRGSVHVPHERCVYNQVILHSNGARRSARIETFEIDRPTQEVAAALHNIHKTTNTSLCKLVSLLCVENEIDDEKPCHALRPLKQPPTSHACSCVHTKVTFCPRRRLTSVLGGFSWNS